MNFFVSKQASWLLLLVAAVILMLSSFWIGMAVGERKSAHFGPWYESYRRGFGPMPAGPGRLPPPGGLPGAHGLTGKIVAASPMNVVIQGRNMLEQNVLIASSTQIRVGFRDGTVADLRPETDVVIFGAPAVDGGIQARLIRVFGKEE